MFPEGLCDTRTGRSRVLSHTSLLSHVLVGSFLLGTPAAVGPVDGGPPLSLASSHELVRLPGTAHGQSPALLRLRRNSAAPHLEPAAQSSPCRDLCLRALTCSNKSEQSPAMHPTSHDLHVGGAPPGCVSGALTTSKPPVYNSLEFQLSSFKNG